MTATTELVQRGVREQDAERLTHEVNYLLGIGGGVEQSIQDYVGGGSRAELIAYLDAVRETVSMAMRRLGSQLPE